MNWIYGLLLVLVLAKESLQKEFLRLQVFSDNNCHDVADTWYMLPSGICSCLHYKHNSPVMCPGSIYCCGIVTTGNVSMTCAGPGIVYAEVDGPLDVCSAYGSKSNFNKRGTSTNYISYKVKLVNWIDPRERQTIIAVCIVVPIAALFLGYLAYVNYKKKEGFLYCRVARADRPQASGGSADVSIGSSLEPLPQNQHRNQLQNQPQNQVQTQPHNQPQNQTQDQPQNQPQQTQDQPQHQTENEPQDQLHQVAQSSSPGATAALTVPLSTTTDTGTEMNMDTTPSPVAAPIVQ